MQVHVLLNPAAMPRLAAALVISLCSFQIANAQTPIKPIRLIVPYAAGGPIDVTARALAERVKDSLGPVIIENRPGAGGNIGADTAKRLRIATLQDFLRYARANPGQLNYGSGGNGSGCHLAGNRCTQHQKRQTLGAGCHHANTQCSIARGTRYR
jgi:tripartite-type tricarboxylate transporter receptor subunit TctC